MKAYLYPLRCGLCTGPCTSPRANPANQRGKIQIWAFWFAMILRVQLSTKCSATDKEALPPHVSMLRLSWSANQSCHTLQNCSSQHDRIFSFSASRDCLVLCALCCTPKHTLVLRSCWRILRGLHSILIVSGCQMGGLRKTLELSPAALWLQIRYVNSYLQNTKCWCSNISEHSSTCRVAMRGVSVWQIVFAWVQALWILAFQVVSRYSRQWKCAHWYWYPNVDNRLYRWLHWPNLRRPIL
jgi:hypothetical protein